YGKYAGVVADVFFDHFLARNFSEFSTESLADFTQRVYARRTTGCWSVKASMARCWRIPVCTSGAYRSSWRPGTESAMNCPSRRSA
ncbi:MAG: DUF479 domain-containing protein, partial [Hymenobacter sp.]